MTKKVTKEEKLQDIAEAKKCFEEAHALMEKGKRLITRNITKDVKITAVNTDGGRCYLPREEADMIEVHLYSGILKLEKLLGEKTRPGISWDGKKDNTRKVMIVNGMSFFQLGNATQHKFNYK